MVFIARYLGLAIKTPHLLITAVPFKIYMYAKNGFANKTYHINHFQSIRYFNRIVSLKFAQISMVSNV